MTDHMSPPAQAVYDATTTAAIRDNADWPVTIAAALRAAADQVAPLSGRLGNGYRQHRSANAERLAIRRELLAIATELEGFNG